MRSLDNALILLDPDNGLIVPSARGKRRCKYVAYERVGRVCETAGQRSVVAIFQHSARRKWPDDLVRLGRELRLRSGLEHLYCIAPDSSVAYFLTTRSGSQAERLGTVLVAYARHHSCRHILTL